MPSPQTVNDLIGVLQQHPMVGSQVGLALGSVDEQRVDGVGRQLDMRREAGAAASCARC